MKPSKHSSVLVIVLGFLTVLVFSCDKQFSEVKTQTPPQILKVESPNVLVMGVLAGGSSNKTFEEVKNFQKYILPIEFKSALERNGDSFSLSLDWELGVLVGYAPLGQKVYEGTGIQCEMTSEHFKAQKLNFKVTFDDNGHEVKRTGLKPGVEYCFFYVLQGMANSNLEGPPDPDGRIIILEVMMKKIIVDLRTVPPKGS